MAEPAAYGCPHTTTDGIGCRGTGPRFPSLLLAGITSPARRLARLPMMLGTRIAVCAALMGPALAASAQTLQVAVSAPVTSIDPHYHNLSPNISLSTQIFNRLIEMDEQARLVPGLAESWKLVAPDAWELKL